VRLDRSKGQRGRAFVHQTHGPEGQLRPSATLNRSGHNAAVLGVASHRTLRCVKQSLAPT
jgi:hypothetical protein